MQKQPIYLIGNAHLDPAWLWRWHDGYNEVMQTFRSALDRLSEYDFTVFTCSSAAYYRWVEETDPQMFEEIKQRVKEGRWVIVNGWNVQPDCNMPSAESFARHALYSQLYYYEKFGIICHTGYNVDSFGHNAMIPQLLRQGGMKNYVMMRPGMHENPNIPEGVFQWESPDGSRVLTYRIQDPYCVNGTKAIDDNIGFMGELADKNDTPTMLYYGVGNHGGGPTKGDIEYLYNKKQHGTEHELVFSSPDAYFDDLCKLDPDLPVWKSEMQHHASGCYSATSVIKQLNRKSENMLYTAEVFDTVANRLLGKKSEREKLAEAWDTVCFNQFHDILCGCSIMEVYEDAVPAMGHAMTVADRVRAKALVEISRSIDTWIDGVSDTVTSEVRHLGISKNFPRPVVVFNSLSWDVKIPVRTLYPALKVTDHTGKEVAFANVRASRSNDSHLDTVFLGEIPALGYAVYWLYPVLCDDEELRYLLDKPANEGDITIENEYIKAVFDHKSGCISSLTDKNSGYDYAAEHELAVPTVIDDHATDTWAHNVFKFDTEKGTMKLISAELVEKNDIRSVVRTKHDLNGSVLTQEFILAKEQKTLRVKCKALWKEPFTMLKMKFDIGGSDPVTASKIPGGFIKRECNGDEEPCTLWTDVTVTASDGKRYGLSVLNDSKYSYSCPGSALCQTFLRNVIISDHYSFRPEGEYNFTDEGMQRFEYGIYLHDGEVELSDVTRQALQLNNKPYVVQESCHKGTRPQREGFVKLSADNVVVTAFKNAEDGSGAAIIRVSETKGIEETRVSLMSDLLDCGFWFDIRKNQILTFRVEPDGSASQVNFLEGIIPSGC